MKDRRKPCPIPDVASFQPPCTSIQSESKSSVNVTVSSSKSTLNLCYKKMAKANITAMRPNVECRRKHFANDFRKLCFYIVSNQAQRAFEGVEMILQRLIHKIQNHLGRFMFGIEREHLVYELSCCHIFEFFLPSSFSTSFIKFYGWQKFVDNRLVVIGRHQLDI